jgi:hypothetical protein
MTHFIGLHRDHSRTTIIPGDQASELYYVPVERDHHHGRQHG